MLKFFRKNEKISRWILIVGMTFLMVSWLVFDRSSSFLTEVLTGRSTWATTVDGEVITEGDIARLQQETRIIGMIGDPLVRTLGLEKDPVHWYLLTLEAERAGLVGGAANGQARLAEVAAANKVPERNLISALCRESGQTPTEVFETLAKLNAVDRYVNLVTSGPARISSTRLEQSAAALLAAVSGEMVVLDGVKSKVEVGAPSEAALQAQLLAFGAIKRGEGTNGFGYRLDDRIKLEWISIPSTAVTALVEQSPALSNIELRKYWIEHQAEFAPLPISSTPPEAPSFDGSRTAVRAKVLASINAEKSKEISKFISDRMQLSMRGIPQVNGYYTLTAESNANQVPLATLADEIAAKFAIVAPTVQTNGDGWLAPKDVSQIPGLGIATTTKFGAQPVNAGQLVGALREFGGKSTLIVQVGVTSPILQDAAGDLFAFRVTAAEPSSAPTTVDAVRDALVADLNSLARFEKLQGMTSEIQREAIDQGLGAVAATYGVSVEAFRDLRQGELQFLQFGLKFPGQLPVLGSAPDVVKAVVERAMSLPTGRQISDLPVTERTLVLPAPEKLAIAVVRIDSIIQMHRGDVPTLVANPRFRSVVATDAASGSPQDLFTLDALTARHGFALVNPKKVADPSAVAPVDAANPVNPPVSPAGNPAKAGQ